MPQISAFVKLIAKPGKRDEMVAAFEQVRPLVDAEEGTIAYTVHLDASEEDVVWMYEQYVDQAAFDAHGSGEALAQIFGALGGLVGAAPEIHFATPVGGKGFVDV